MSVPRDYRPLLLRNQGNEKARHLDHYLAHGGYTALKKALFEMTPKDVIQEVMASNLRGRGGAGFPTGLKWSFVPKDTDQPKYVVVNADEGEPGTFKDRDILRFDPHLMIEGALIAAYAIGARETYIYIRAEYYAEYRILLEEIEAAYKKNLLGHSILGSNFDHDMYVFLGAGAYICGEETALLESLEGKQGQPRLRPPYPATYGLYGHPTVVNNVETLANVPFIIEKGARWYTQFGTEKSTGPKIFSISGAVQKPGNYEFPLGSLTLGELIYEVAQGGPPGRKIIGAFPGGISAPVLTPEEFDTPLDFESLAAKKTMLGSGAVMVMDDSFSPVTYARRMVQFFSHESCGKCTPCREGVPWLLKIMRKIEAGKGTQHDLHLLHNVADGIEGTTFCPLGHSAAVVLKSFLDKFPEAFEAAVK